MPVYLFDFEAATPREPLGHDLQRRMIDTIVDAQAGHRVRCFGAAAGGTRFHALIAWDDQRDPAAVQRALSRAIERGLARVFGRQRRLGDATHHKRVRNRTQFDYLLRSYLPKQEGLAWTVTQGFHWPYAASA